MEKKEGTVSHCEPVLLYLLKRRERAPGWSGDDGLHLAPGQPMKRIENCASQEEGEHHEKLQLDLRSSSLAPAARGLTRQVAKQEGKVLSAASTLERAFLFFLLLVLFNAPKKKRREVSGKQLGLLCSARACSLLKNDYPVATSSHGETECSMCSVRYAPEALWERK